MNKMTRILPFLALVLSGCAGLQPGCVSDAQEAYLSTAEQWLYPSQIDATYLYFHKSLNTRPYGYEIVAAPHPVRYGEKADRFEVRPGDCSDSYGYNDCAKDRERSELSEAKPKIFKKRNLSHVGREYWYGWSIFVPTDYPNVYPTKVTLGQFPHSGGHTPAVSFQNYSGGYWLDFTETSGQTGDYRNLITEDDFKGRWHDIVVNAKWCTGSDGFFKVWVNGELKAEVFGPNTYSNKEIFFKFGVYRSYLSRHGKPVPAQIVYFDEVRKGLKREDVDILLRGGFDHEPIRLNPFSKTK